MLHELILCPACLRPSHNQQQPGNCPHCKTVLNSPQTRKEPTCSNLLEELPHFGRYLPNVIAAVNLMLPALALVLGIVYALTWLVCLIIEPTTPATTPR